MATEKQFNASINSISDVTEFINSIIEPAGCPIKVQMQIAVIIDEVFGNIAQYSGMNNNDAVSVSAECSDGSLKIVFSDSGIPYNPLERTDPDTTLSSEDREEGGLGIYLVKKLADNVEYCRSGNNNTLSVTKKW